MKALILKEMLRVYLATTLVMVINAAILISLAACQLGRHDTRAVGSQTLILPDVVPANGDRGARIRNISQFDSLRIQGDHVDLRTVLDACGKPDGYTGDPNSEMSMIYFYDASKEKDWVAYMWFKNGILDKIGYNDASVNNHSCYKTWDIPDKDIPAHQ